MLCAPARAAETLATLSVGPPGTFNAPIDLTIDDAGNTIVADTGNHRVVKLAPDGTIVWAVGRADMTRGSGPGEFSSPKDVAVGPDGNVYVADADNGRVAKLGPDGAFLATFNMPFGPQGITIDADGTIFVADSSGDRVHRLSPSGTLAQTIGSSGAGPGQFTNPYDVSVAGGFLYVADGNNHRVQKLRTDGTFVQAWGAEGEAPGQFLQPIGVSATADGRVFVIDKRTARLDVFSADGRHLLRFGDERQLSIPGGVFARGADIAIADTGNSRVVRLISAQTPPPGAFCDSATGTCAVGPNGVPTVAMPRGERSPVRFVTPLDACERLGRGPNQGREGLYDGRRYPIQQVPEGHLLEIPADQLVAGSAIIAWRCARAAPASGVARAAQFDFDIVNENVGDVTLIDPSGFIRDAGTGRGLAGAVVTLQSQAAGAAGFAFADPLGVSPRVNPQRSDRRGHYGWDVPQGSWRIAVTAFGYRPLRASRVVFVPPAVTDLHVRLRRDPAQQRRLIDPSGAVGRLRLGMARALAVRVAGSLRPRPRLGFRGGRLARIEVRSPRYRTVAGIGPGARAGLARLAYGRGARGARTRLRVGRATFVLTRGDGSGRVRAVVLAR